jgi:hypothetical protein
MNPPVVFIGAGPGSADLITLRGAQRLARADVVLHDALTDPALRAFAPQARWIDVGKRGFCDATGQARINALLVRHAREGSAVVRLKGGDPSVFGRLEEELQALGEAGIEAEVVPGVTAALAAAAATQRPLTTPRCSTWPVASWARFRGAWSTRAGHTTRRCSWCRAPDGPTSLRATTAWTRWPRRRCCTAGGRRSSPWASAQGLLRRAWRGCGQGYRGPR